MDDSDGTTEEGTPDRPARDGAWDGDAYQARLDAMAAEGRSMHGEADLVCSLEPSPTSVLDAGCGTGRVGVELARRGIDVVGVDVDPSMLTTARRQAPELTWVEADLASVELGRAFDVVLLAGNVVLFTEPGAQPAVLAGAARHLAPGGALVAGFQLGRGWELADHEAACAAAGLEPAERWSTWERDPWPGDGSYVVALHRRAH